MIVQVLNAGAVRRSSAPDALETERALVVGVGTRHAVTAHERFALAACVVGDAEHDRGGRRCTAEAHRAEGRRADRGVEARLDLAENGQAERRASIEHMVRVLGGETLVVEQRPGDRLDGPQATRDPPAATSRWP